MSFGFRACPQSLNVRTSKSSNYIWISDDFLSTLLHQFAVSKRCVRNGSSVPGPLEFRKRAAKRRMMNLTVVATQSIPIDLRAFAGMHGNSVEKGMRWEAPIQPSKSLDPTSRGESKTTLTSIFVILKSL